MGKKSLSAKAVLQDIKVGMSDDELKKKYGISDKGLQLLFSRLIEAKLITQTDLDLRNGDDVEVLEVEIIEETPKTSLPQQSNPAQGPIETDTAPLEKAQQAPKDTTEHTFSCPACGMPQFREYEVCPQCGVIVENFKEKQIRERAARKREHEHFLQDVRSIDNSPADRVAVKENLNRRWVLIVIGIVIALCVLTIIKWSRSLEEKRISREHTEKVIREAKQAIQEAREKKQQLMRELPTCEHVARLWNSAVEQLSHGSSNALGEALKIKEHYSCGSYLRPMDRKFWLRYCYGCADRAADKLDFIEVTIIEGDIVGIRRGCRCR